MPIIGVVEAIRRLRDRGSTVRILIVTGAEEARLTPEAHEAGADGSATKPPVGEQLIATMFAKAPET